MRRTGGCIGTCWFRPCWLGLGGRRCRGRWRRPSHGPCLDDARASLKERRGRHVFVPQSDVRHLNALLARDRGCWPRKECATTLSFRQARGSSHSYLSAALSTGCTRGALRAFAGSKVRRHRWIRCNASISRSSTPRCKPSFESSRSLRAWAARFMWWRDATVGVGHDVRGTCDRLRRRASAAGRCGFARHEQRVGTFGPDGPTHPGRRDRARSQRGRDRDVGRGRAGGRQHESTWPAGVDRDRPR
jgi:hypothetical protein